MSKIASDNEVRKWKPEGLDLSAGPVPVFPIYIFTETRELQHLETGASCEPRSAKDLRRFEFSVLGFLAVAPTAFFRKEVFQPHLPVRLPCYDLAPITSFALGRSSR